MAELPREFLVRLKCLPDRVLVVVYQRERGPIDRLYYEPRGILYEPHTGKAIPLGTREVADYQFPAWLYDKILYVEKKGLWPVLEAARLAERHDMAIVAGEGYACEACRALFANAEQGKDYQLFVVHDADPYGYNIARTLREETQRMPGHHVEVIDLGLKLEEALEMGLETETFTRRRALPKELQLTETERAYFEGERSFKSWVAQRVELNALSAPALVQYIEEKLQAAGVRGKVIPDDELLVVHAASIYEGAIDSEAKLILEEFLPFEKFKDALRHFKLRKGGLSLRDARSWIEEAFAADATLSWSVALKARIGRLPSGERDKLEKVLRRRLLQVIKDFSKQKE